MDGILLLREPDRQNTMRTAAKTKAQKPSRSAEDAFEAVAKRLECDEDKARFEAKLAKLAKPMGTKKKG